ncbi:MAG: DUF2247 family protein [Clostridia bacterium]|nr:DUF2247 family protein [Clostridia bacterium]
MIRIDDFKEKGLNISWKLIDIGFRGSEEFYGELSSNDVINYAISYLDNNFENIEYKLLIESIACEYEEDIEQLNYYIQKLVEMEKNIDEKLEFRKWVYIYVYKNIHKNENYVQGLIDLTEMWGKLNFPHNSPHIIQGVNNKINPKEYYSLDNYNEILKKHFEWLNKELENIKKEESIK